MERRQFLRVGGSALVAGAGAYGLFGARVDGWADSVGDGATSTEAAKPCESAGEDGERRSGTVGARDGETLLGDFPGAIQDRSEWAAFQQWQGHPGAISIQFSNVGMERSQVLHFVENRLSLAWQRGRVPHLLLQPLFGEETGDDVERRIADGEHDQALARWRDAILQWLKPSSKPDRRLYLNFASEMNGHWMPWSAADSETTPDDFVAMWRTVHRLFGDTCLDDGHLQWVWTPNIEYNGVDHPSEEYYPGDEYVDWIGVTGYNWGATEDWSKWRSPEAVYGDTIDRMRALADKPIALPEFGTTSLTEGGHNAERKGEWIESAFDFIGERDVKMACWFNVVKETDWAIFGGERGTDTFVHDGTEYPVYGEYRAAANRDGVLVRNDGHPRRLNDDEFQGEF